MTTTASPIASLADLARQRSASNASKHAEYQDRAEPRSTMSIDYTTSNNINNNNASHHQQQGHAGEYPEEYHNQQQHYTNGNSNGYSHPAPTLPSSSQPHYPHGSVGGGSYLPPPIQTTPFGNGAGNNGVHPHAQTGMNSSFASPISPVVSPSPLSPGNAHQYQQQQAQQGHYEYDQYHHSYHAHHRQHQLEKVDNANNASYSSSASSTHHPRNHSHSNHHGSMDEQPDSPNSVPTNSTSDSNMAYSTSAPSTTSAQNMLATRMKRRSEVFASHESPYFYPAQQQYNLYSMDRSTSFNIKISAKIDRGFFLAANDWTCYRRNYFQISASFSIHWLDTSMHPEVPCLMDRNGEFVQVNQFLICIGAQIQNGEKTIELVQHTPKRDKGPQITPRPTAVRAGGDLSLYASGSSSNVITFERVQFKTATANNGKRRAAQQYYQVHVDLFAETETGELVLVANSFSAPLVVRGRSPGHYADNEEGAPASSTQPMDSRYSYRNDSISSGGGPMSPPGNGDYPYYPNYGYGSSYQYQSLGSASHIAAQSQESSYYERHESESYPTSPLSPVSRHPGTMETPQPNHPHPYMTQVHHGFSPASVSPDMYSPPNFIAAGPESPASFSRAQQFPSHSNQEGHYAYGSSSYSQYSQDQDHEVQMAGLRIHSPVSPGSPVTGTPRRQSFSSSLSFKKGDRGIVGPTRKSRSISMSGVSKRAPGKTRPSRTVPVSPTRELVKGLGITTDRIPEEEQQS